MHIDADFDSASILVPDEVGDDRDLDLALRDDNAAPFRHWFHYQVETAAGEPLRMRIGNAGESSYANGWEDGYRACASYDGESWFRVPTTYEDGALVIEHVPDRDLVGYACFAPYPYERHQRLVERAASSPLARVETLGESVEGRPISGLILGDPRGLRVWVIARQHPGETMAEWFMEGAVDRLLDEDDPVTRVLLDIACVVLVPNMNPDGSIRGNHRTNAAGRDLNRAWSRPNRRQSPEVRCVRKAMLDGGVDLFLDVHGDESIPYVFAAGVEGVPRYSDRQKTLEDRFREHLADVDPDFQIERGYPRDPPGQADLRLAANWTAQRFDCLSLTIEMPFHDNANEPDPERGWSPERSRRFGHNTLETVAALLPDLR